MSRVVIPGQPVLAQSGVSQQQQPVIVQQVAQSPVRVVQQSPVRVVSQGYVEQRDSDGEDDDEAKQDKRMVNFCILLLPFLLAFLLFIACCRFLHNHLNTKEILDGADNVLEYAHKNINTNPINQFRQTTDGAGNNCPTGFDLMHLGEWEGIDRGCICPGDSNVWRKESYLKCMSFSDNGCKYQSGFDKIDYQYWINKNVGFCKKSVQEDDWVRKAVCDTTENTYCGPTTCLKTLNAQCPPNQWNPSNMANPSTSIDELLGEMAHDNNSISNFSYVVLRKSKKKTDGTYTTPRIAQAFYHKLGTLQGSTQQLHSRSSLIGFEISQGKTRCLNNKFVETNNEIYTLDHQQSKNTKCDRYGALVNDYDAEHVTYQQVQQVTVLDTTKQSAIYNTNGDLKTVYNQDTLANYNTADFVANEVSLLGIAKMRINPISECNGVFDEDLADAPRHAHHARNTVRVFAWILLILTCITVFLGILFLLAALSKFFAKKHATKVKIARFYWFSSWFLVGLSILIFILWHILFTWVIRKEEEKLSGFKNNQCFPDNNGVQLAIGQLEKFDNEVDSNFTPLINEMFIYSIVYAVIWMAIVAFWKQKYSQFKKELQ